MATPGPKEEYDSWGYPVRTPTGECATAQQLTNKLLGIVRQVALGVQQQNAGSQPLKHP